MEPPYRLGVNMIKKKFIIDKEYIRIEFMDKHNKIHKKEYSKNYNQEER